MLQISIIYVTKLTVSKNSISCEYNKMLGRDFVFDLTIYV